MIRGAVLTAEDHDEEAIRVFGRRRSLADGTGSDQLFAYVLNRRARFLLGASPDPVSTRDAVDLGRKAVSLAPQARDYMNTLGIALCRAGRDAEALPYLEESLARGLEQTDGQDLYFLAIVHHRLGHEEEARADLARAMSWHSRRRFARPAQADELDRFRTEAQAILSLPPAKPIGNDWPSKNKAKISGTPVSNRRSEESARRDRALP